VSFTKSVFDAAAFSTQATMYYCTAAVCQYITNLTREGNVHSGAEQAEMYAYGRTKNRYPYAARGNDPQAVVEMLKHYTGVGTWHVGKYATMRGALKHIASRMDATNLPGVLFVAGGGHVWTMDGFTTSEDPSAEGDFSISRVRFSGPLYPKQVAGYGWYDLAPGTWKSDDAMAYPFFKYDERLAFNDGRAVPWEDYFIVVAP